ncbi:MAG: hypothetical protein OSB03_11595 [Vicinamibacterales bacterium]|nr:hypothetical protein [Vicinamibacterales bacterium]
MAPRNERRSALLVTLLTTVLMAGLVGGLAITVMTEEAIEANHRRAVSEVAGRPRWQSLLDGTVPSALRVGPAVRTLADGSSVDLARVTNALQRELDRARGDGVPRWRLYAWGWRGDLVTGSSHDRLLLVAAWVRGGIGGGAPRDDADERIVVRAAAFGPFGTRRAVEAALGRGPER